eukprot:Blabericola_migrator_1__11249@NODE_6619_length_497_cov_106_351163_g3182_i1_p1_GENE_NODE_6619_length_497_cov_106_351163_g3182_i1NODE_6619_length_497_cov_106_351163_g3182_i1_p1_ORF_typecomplete_len132_score10_65_NODE_6619_length_497_cov_106_351163_g3182_i130425
MKADVLLLIVCEESEWDELVQHFDKYPQCNLFCKHGELTEAIISNILCGNDGLYWICRVQLKQILSVQELVKKRPSCLLIGTKSTPFGSSHIALTAGLMNTSVKFDAEILMSCDIPSQIHGAWTWGCDAER